MACMKVPLSLSDPQGNRGHPRRGLPAQGHKAVQLRRGEDLVDHETHLHARLRPRAAVHQRAGRGEAAPRRGGVQGHREVRLHQRAQEQGDG